MPNLRKSILATRILLLFGAFAVTPAAAASFDGQWNVQITSTNSACSGRANVSIGISNGRVQSANAMMTASGRVAEAGAINVTLTRGIKRAVGSGYLTATTCSGTMCSGTWTAQRI
jgi:hypothetical protein